MIGLKQVQKKYVHLLLALPPMANWVGGGVMPQILKYYISSGGKKTKEKNSLCCFNFKVVLMFEMQQEML